MFQFYYGFSLSHYAFSDVRRKNRFRISSSTYLSTDIKQTKTKKKYTDGSAVIAVCRAGFAWVNVYTKNQYIGRVDGAQTNDRAELRAIEEALAAHKESPAIVINTDSQECINRIRTWTSPYTSGKISKLANHDILEEILNHIEIRSHRGYSTEFRKVKSHVGIKGNTQADQGADAGRALDNAKGSGSRDEYQLFYGESQIEGSALKQIKKLLANKDAVAASKGKLRNRPSCEIDMVASTAYMSSGTHSDWEKIRVFKARIGAFVTYATLNLWYGATNPKFSSPNCPLCNAHTDSVGHITSSCPVFHAYYTQRHNEAARIVLDGLAETYGEENLTDGGKDAISPDLLPVGSPKIGSKPDGVVLVKNDRGETEKILLMEFKHPCENAEEGASELAAAQWPELAEEIRAHFDWEPDQVPIYTITITNLGYIPRESKAAIRKMGLSHSQMEKIINKLHHHAIKSFITLTGMRYQQIREIEKRARQTP
jgi:ribonuclease HI